MSRIAIIPARGGSKRIPRKNIREFLGKPIIAYSIQLALRSELFDEVMVSTDDEEIAEISRSYGASIPFMRSEVNSNDFAGTVDVIRETLLNYESLNVQFNHACCIYPTSPLTAIEDIINSYNLMIDGNYDTVFPIVQFSYPIQRAFSIDSLGNVGMIWPENLTKRSQDLSPTYHDAGQFYWLKSEIFLAKKLLFSENSGAYIMDEIKVQDIDSQMDWVMAQVKYEVVNGK